MSGAPGPAVAAIMAKRAARLEDFTFLIDNGATVEEAAKRLEVSLKTAEKYDLERRAAGGLPWPLSAPWWPGGDVSS